MASGLITSWQIGEKLKTVPDSLFLESKITVDNDCSHEIKRHLFLGGKAVTNLDSILKSKDITLPTKAQTVKAMFFSLVMYGWILDLDHKEDWAPKNWCFRIVVLKKILESTLDCKDIKPVNREENEP